MPLNAERLRSRHPFELFFLYLVVATSVAGLAAKNVRPGSIQEGVGHVGSLIWYVALLGGGLAALIGIFWRERATGLVLEAVGLFVSGIATSFYGVSAIVLLGGVALWPGVNLIGYGAAAVWRSIQIRSILVRVDREHRYRYRG